MLVTAQVLAHWLVSGLPMVLLAPVLGLSLGMSQAALNALVATLAIGTPLLSLIGAVGVALTVGLRRGGLLLTLLILPLYIPVLIFATSAVSAAAAGLPVGGQLYLLAALLALALTLAPFAIAAALRISSS
jgi:heme exporter protein B